MTTNKQEILEEVKRGNITSFYKKTKLSFTGFLRRKSRDYELIDEAINDAFLRLAQKIHMFRGTTYQELYPYMERIVYSVFLNKIKTQNKFMCRGEMVYKPDQSIARRNYYDYFLEDTIAPKEKSISSARIDLIPILDFIRDNLTPLQYQRICMYGEGYKYKEIAKSQNVAIGTIKNDIYEIQTKLRNKLKLQQYVQE